MSDACLVFKALTANFLRFYHILPVDVRTLVFEGRCRHVEHIPVLQFRSHLQQQHSYLRIIGQTVGKNAASCPSTN